MNNYDKILEMVEKNNGYISSKEVNEKGINRMFLSKLVEKGTLVRLDRGYYGLSQSIEDEYYKKMLKSKNAIFSMSTALYLHDLSDRTPLFYDMTVPYYYGGSLNNTSHVKLYFVKKDLLDLGVMEMTSPYHTTIRVYDQERTICDIIKNKDKMDREIFSTALKKYAHKSDKDLHKLMKYAKMLKVEKKVIDYMEVLL